MTRIYRAPEGMVFMPEDTQQKIDQLERDNAKLRAELTPHELERIERLKKRARYLQNKIDERPRYEMGHSKAELSALKWAIERITGQPLPFVDDAAMQPVSSDSREEKK